VRPILAVIAALGGAALAAWIMAEYEFEGYTPWAAGIAVGVLVGELIASAGRWKGVPAMVVSGVIAAGSLLWGEWLESDRGIEAYSVLAFGAAAVAAAVAAWTTRPVPLSSRTSAGS
jgi:hypothetical protein